MRHHFTAVLATIHWWTASIFLLCKYCWYISPICILPHTICIFVVTDSHVPRRYCLYKVPIGILPRASHSWYFDLRARQRSDVVLCPDLDSALYAGHSPDCVPPNPLIQWRCRWKHSYWFFQCSSSRFLVSKIRFWSKVNLCVYLLWCPNCIEHPVSQILVLLLDSWSPSLGASVISGYLFKRSTLSS